MSDVLNNISIAKIKGYNFEGVKSYGDDLVMANRIDHLTIFKNPCRVDGVVVFVCLTGKVVSKVNMRTYELNPGDLLVNFNSSTIQAEGTQHFEALAVLVSYAYLDKLRININNKLSFYMGVRDNAVTHLSDGDIASFCDLFNLMERNAEDAREGRDGIMDTLIQLLGKMLIRLAQAAGPQVDSERKPLRSEQIFEKFIELVTLHHGAKRNTSFFATELGLTPNYLSSMVKTCSGRSSADWINEYTVSEAKLMLRFSDMSVQQIATNLSFPSQSAFGKFFKQHVGLNPNQFRREANA